jgi:signal peptide peptidase SppA
MRFLNNALSGRSPLLIDPAIAKTHADTAEKFGFTDLLQQIFGETPKPYKVGSVGVIPIVGVIGKGLSPIEKMTGSADLNDINANITAYESDPEVKSIIFHIDSPGGVVGGVEETARKILNLSKPTVAYTDGMMASAAYWLGASADRVVASPSADVGSVGVYMAIPDMSGLYKASGINMVVIKSSATPLKAAGLEGTSLTDAQIQNYQEQVDAIYTDFVSSIKVKRKMVQAEALQGQTMSGKIAATKGLLTGLSDSIDSLIGSTGKPIVSTVSAKSAKSVQPKAVEIEQDVLDMLTPRQKEMIDSMGDIEETFGQFDQTSGPDGAHYAAPSPFAAQGLVCQNCVYYRGPRGCQLVSGDIDPNAICKLWVIPGGMIKE